MDAYTKLMAMPESVRERLVSGLETFSDSELERVYCEMLDEAYGTIRIAGLEYETSRALASVDPVAFRCGFADWLGTEDRFTELGSLGYFNTADLEQALDEAAAT